MGPSFLQRLCPPCTPAVALAAAAAAAPAWLAPVRPHVTPRRRPAAPRLLGPGHPRLAPACLRRSSSSTSAGNGCDMTKYPPEKIRNFSIIAHIDHGKSTLADRLLEITGTIAKSGENKQVLDKLKVERDRGITVKAQTVSMFHNGYLLNLIDTPGHVDFSYEVSRSLAACQGTLLLVDASKGKVGFGRSASVTTGTSAKLGIESDTPFPRRPGANRRQFLPCFWSRYHDYSHYQQNPDKVAEEIHNVFELDPTSIVKISAKTGLNVEEIFPNVLENIPPFESIPLHADGFSRPQGDIHKPLKALLFDQWYDKYQGVVCMTAIIDGTVCKGDKVMSAHTKIKYEVHEVSFTYRARGTNEKKVAFGQITDQTFS
ncbi:MAG: hypothetical protein BJ554DRAFT_1432 [Olpidium bornovanus]|uniref:Tr-type G domain-containing protein n=1 Tax=Olpidium bornovanus TaxID=278681 RepID=A0A8H7ZRT8_9FUNG|nr:MAG: hypothetical protein BJ554DRAFT_1432 [Olpidium bornovanus]